jgi:hypothetical protein
MNERYQDTARSYIVLQRSTLNVYRPIARTTMPTIDARAALRAEQRERRLSIRKGSFIVWGAPGGAAGATMMKAASGVITMRPPATEAEEKAARDREWSKRTYAKYYW